MKTKVKDKKKWLLFSFGAAALLAVIVCVLSAYSFRNSRDHAYLDPQRGIMAIKIRAFEASYRETLAQLSASASVLESSIVEQISSAKFSPQLSSSPDGAYRVGSDSIENFGKNWVVAYRSLNAVPNPDLISPSSLIQKLLLSFPNTISSALTTAYGTEMNLSLGSHPTDKLTIPKQSPYLDNGIRVWLALMGESTVFVVSLPLYVTQGGVEVEFGRLRVVEPATQRLERLALGKAESRMAITSGDKKLFVARNQAPDFLPSIRETVSGISSYKGFALAVAPLEASDLVLTIAEPLPFGMMRIVLHSLLVFIVSFLLFALCVFLPVWRSHADEKSVETDAQAVLKEISSYVAGELSTINTNGQQQKVSETDAAVAAKIRRLVGYYQSRAAELEIFYKDFTHLVEASDSAVIELDENGVITRLTTSFSNMLNCTPSKLMHVNFRKLLMGANERKKFDAEWQFISQGGKLAFETRLAAGGNIPVIVSFTGIPRTTASGKFKGAIALLTDQSRYYLHKRNDYMNSRLNEISELAAEVAHNFNNALSAIMGSIALVEIRLRKQDPKLLDGAIGDNINTMRDASNKATLLVRQLMKLSPGAREFGGESELISVLHEVISDLRGRCDIATYFDESQRILVPLNKTSLANSIRDVIKMVLDRQRTEGRIAVQVGVIKSREAPIASNGAIAEKLVAFIEIFRENNDEDASLAEAGSSTGLRWLEAQRAIVDVGGGIVADSATLPAPNVIVYLPVILRADEVLNVREHKPLNILIIDDDSSVSSTVAAYLNELGQHTIVSSVWDEALKAVSDKEIHLVLLDKTFRKMTLETMVSLIRGARQDVKLALISGTPLTTLELRKVAEWGVIAFLQKPIMLDDLTLAVSKTIKSLSR